MFKLSFHKYSSTRITLAVILLVLPLLLSAFIGCRGGEPGAYIIGEGLYADGGDGQNGDDDDNDNGGDKTPSMTCPFPKKLPFETESQGFENDASKTLADEASFMKNEHLDIIGLPDVEQTAIGRMARGMNSLKGIPFAGEWVSLWIPQKEGDWKNVGRKKTDEKGFYNFAIPEEDKFGVGSYAFYALLEGDGSCVLHGSFLWPSGTQVVMTDIDGTLTLDDQELMRQLQDESYDPIENGSASQLINKWRSKGYRIIYLTARPHGFKTPSRKWLSEHNFPFGPTITADTLVFGDSARAYKREWVSKIIKEFKWNVVAAYGNAESDIDAYEDGGIPKNITFIIGEKAGVSGTVAIPDQDFAAHIAEHVEKQPDADQPF